MDDLLRQLVTQLELMAAKHDSLLDLVRRKQQAIRMGQADLVAETCTLENEHIQHIAELEKQRQQTVGHLTQSLSPAANEPLRITQIADAVDEPRRGQLLLLHQKMRQTMQTIQRENDVSKRAAEGLLRHVQGIVQQVQQVIGGATYGRRGSVSPATVSMNSISITA
ncbi:MAG: flagellar export chaperone FlgN [Phycisphaeraceae bacterium]